MQTELFVAIPAHPGGPSTDAPTASKTAHPKARPDTATVALEKSRTIL